MSAQLVTRHRTLRWFGVPLFWLGAAGLLAAIGAKLGTQGSWGGVMLYMGAIGLSLASFGLHNDTAIALMVRLQEPLPAPARAELDRELSRDRLGTNTLSPSPRASYVAMGLALLLHTAAAWRLMGSLDL